MSRQVDELSERSRSPDSVSDIMSLSMGWNGTRSSNNLKGASGTSSSTSWRSQPTLPLYKRIVSRKRDQILDTVHLTDENLEILKEEAILDSNILTQIKVSAYLSGTVSSF